MLSLLEPARSGGRRKLPSLDGLRTVSIALVMFAHAVTLFEVPVLARVEERLELGIVGVRTFFVISGFLITTLVFGELERTGRLSLSRFYFRRTLRIMPAFYIFLGAVTVFNVAGVIHCNWRDLAAAGLYVSNFVPHLDRYVGHTWSLSVEEQFYLVWPVLLVALGRRRSLQAAAAYVVVAPLLRIASYFLFPAHRENIDFWFPTVADALACGCLLAGARKQLGASQGYLRFQRSWIFVSVPLLAVAADSLLVHRLLFLAVGQSVLNLSIALCVDWCVRGPATALGRLLNTRAFSAVGVGSYSLYLWQQPFLFVPSQIGAAVRLVAVPALAFVSYHLVEKRFLRWRDRLELSLFGAVAARAKNL